MSNWQFKKLGDLTSKIGSGATPRGGQSNYVDTGVSFIRSQNILDHAMKITDIAHITDDAAHKLRGVTVKAGDVLINITGDSIARCSIVDDNVLPARVNQHVAILRTTPDLNPRFLQKFLVSPTMKKHLINISSGGTRKALTRADLSSLSIPVPPIQEQQAIAEVLGALDDKITANNKLSQKLKELAQAEFTRLMKTAEVTGTLRNILHLEYGKSLPAKNRVDGQVEVFGSGGKVGTHNEALSSGPGVIVGRKGTAGAVHWAPNAYFPIDTTFYVVPADQDFSLVFCFHLLNYLNLDDMNSDSAVPGLNREEALSIPIKIPGRAELKNFSTHANFLFAVVQQLNLESQALNSMRDTLLPQLMSGKIQVREAEFIVENTL